MNPFKFNSLKERFCLIIITFTHYDDILYVYHDIRVQICTYNIIILFITLIYPFFSRLLNISRRTRPKNVINSIILEQMNEAKTEFHSDTVRRSLLDRLVVLRPS